MLIYLLWYKWHLQTYDLFRRDMQTCFKVFLYQETNSLVNLIM